MNENLCIAIEAHWRGSMLDSVSPIATLPLQANTELAGQLTIGSPFQLTLTNGTALQVWCVKTATHRYVLDIKSDNQPSIHMEADAPISSQLRLPDGKIYEFSIRARPNPSRKAAANGGRPGRGHRHGVHFVGPMSLDTFRALLIGLGSTFAIAFLVICLPPLVRNADIIGAFAAGFVNPFAAGYALDVIFCWLVLASWVTYEAKAHGIKHGWVALVLGVAPGVATGFAVYLLLRLAQVQGANNSLES